MAKKIIEEEIDEDFIIASMNTMSPVAATGTTNKKEEAKIEPQPAPVSQEKKEQPVKEDSRRKKTKGDYESLFIRETPITGRKEKTTYLRSKFYRKIQDVILCYDNPNLSVFGYIDTVLAHHFDLYEQEIREILKRRFEES